MPDLNKRPVLLIPSGCQSIATLWRGPKPFTIAFGNHEDEPFYLYILYESAKLSEMQQNA